jgi:hypothetical protein
MKKTALTLGAAAAAALIVAPVAAAERSSAPIADESELSGESPIVLAIALGVAVAAVLIGIELFEDDDDQAVSP